MARKTDIAKAIAKREQPIELATETLKRLHEAVKQTIDLYEEHADTSRLPAEVDTIIRDGLRIMKSHALNMVEMSVTADQLHERATAFISAAAQL